MPFRLCVALLLATTSARAADRSLDDNPELAKYFETQVTQIEADNSLLKYRTLEEWEAAKPNLRQQLFDMLGLNPLPERTSLRPEVTGVIEKADFRVEKLHFQSSPGLYVTGNLYLPKVVDKPLPTILYVCGHARVMKDGVSFGNKTAYQHHGAWFARNGYACLTIDTLQLGEIEGIHHGTYRHDRWWWNSRGYTPAGVEAWNCMRALDYLESRQEVDAACIGVTGRSGGGAYSWWISALDDRIKCAVPVAGMTSLRNHVVDGCVEGHCDCMYLLNTYRWDYATVAALVAPRPLLISNSDKDGIFPLDGVVDVHQQVRHIYDLYDRPRQHGLHITEGPHKDTQELRIHAFRWFNRFLKGDESLVEKVAMKYFEPEQLKVFVDLPSGEKNTTIDESFVPTAAATPRESVLTASRRWMGSARTQLRTHCFGAWPDSHQEWKPDNNVRLERLKHRGNSSNSVVRIHFESQTHVQLFVDVVMRDVDVEDDSTPQQILSQIEHFELFNADQNTWDAYQTEILTSAKATEPPNAVATFIRNETSEVGHAVGIFTGRGIGAHAFIGDKRKLTQIERRFQLIGTTSDTMRIWDLRRALQVTRSQLNKNTSVTLSTNGTGTAVLLASLFDDPVNSIQLRSLSNIESPPMNVFNLQKVMNRDKIPIALAALRCPVMIEGPDIVSTSFVDSLTADARWPGYHVRPTAEPAIE